MSKEFAVITGASSGIGFELTKQFAKAKINVILVSRDEHKLAQVASEIHSSYGVQALVMKCDLKWIMRRA